MAVYKRPRDTEREMEVQESMAAYTDGCTGYTAGFIYLFLSLTESSSDLTIIPR